MQPVTAISEKSDSLRQVHDVPTFIGSTSLDQFGNPAEVNARQKFLNLVLGKHHIGKYEGWIQAEIEKIASKNTDNLQLLFAHQQGLLPPFYPVASSDGLTVLKTSEWIKKVEHQCVLWSTAEKEWRSYQKIFDLAVASAKETATELLKANGLSRTNLKLKSQILTSVADRSLKHLKRNLEVLEQILLEDKARLPEKITLLPGQTISLDGVKKALDLAEISEKERKSLWQQVAAVVEDLKIYSNLFDKCIIGIGAD